MCWYGRRPWELGRNTGGRALIRIAQDRPDAAERVFDPQSLERAPGLPALPDGANLPAIEDEVRRQLEQENLSLVRENNFRTLRGTIETQPGPGAAKYQLQRFVEAAC